MRVNIVELINISCGFLFKTISWNQTELFYDPAANSESTGEPSVRYQPPASANISFYNRELIPQQQKSPADSSTEGRNVQLFLPRGWMIKGKAFILLRNHLSNSPADSAPTCTIFVRIKVFSHRQPVNESSSNVH